MYNFSQGWLRHYILVEHSWVEEFHFYTVQQVNIISQSEYYLWFFLNWSRSQPHHGIWCWLMFSIILFFFLDILSCWEDINLDMNSLIFWEWMPNIMDADQMETSSLIMLINSEWIIRGGIPSSFAESVDVEGQNNWTWPYSIFDWDSMRMEENHLSLLRPSWMSLKHGGG